VRNLRSCKFCLNTHDETARKDGAESNKTKNW